ncbi:MAG: PocR ligand-binding domain-containing protein [Propionivibrio sp.]
MSSQLRLRLVNLAAHFQSVSGVPCYSFDGCGRRLARTDDNPSGCLCLCHHLGINAMTNRCDGVTTHRRGILQAQRFGGSFIYLCPVNLVFWAAPVCVEGNVVGALVAGSVLMIEPEDYPNREVKLENDLNEHELNTLLERLKHIPFVPPAKVKLTVQGAGRNGAWFVATIVRTGKMGLHDRGPAVTHLGIHPSVEGRKRRQAGNEATLSAGQGAVALFTHNARRRKQRGADAA